MVKIFVELAREDDLTLSSAQFLTHNVTVTDSFGDG